PPRPLPGALQQGRHPVRARRIRRRPAMRSHREEAVLPRPPGLGHAHLRDAGVRLPLRLLPELAHQPGAARRRRGRAPDGRDARRLGAAGAPPRRQAGRLVVQRAAHHSRMGRGCIQGGEGRWSQDGVHLERQRHPRSARLHPSLDRLLQDRPQGDGRPALPRARRRAPARAGCDPPGVRARLLARAGDARRARFQRRQRAAQARCRLYRLGEPRDPLARHRIPQGLPHDRPGRHHPGDARPGVRDRGGGGPQVRVRRERPGSGGPLGEHLVPRLRRPARRADRVRDHAAADRRGRPLPRLRAAHSGRVVLGLILLLQAASAATTRPSFGAATFDPLVLEGIREGAYAGAALVVGRRDSVLLAKGYGHLTWSATSRAVDPESTMYDLASLTKVIATTPALMLLVERGRVRLDAPVAAYLPELQGTRTADVTVRQLLAHTSGLRADIPDPELKALPDSAAVMRRVLSEAPRVAPGTRVIYSDLNAILLGAVVHRVVGEPLDAFATREVFAPLGLGSTMFRPPVRLRPRIAPTGVWRGHPVAG